MRRHLRWIIPVLCVPVVYLGGGFALHEVTRQPEFQASVGLGWLAIGIILFTGAGIVTAVVLTVRGGVKTFRDWRRSHGHYSRAERAQRALQAHAELAWNEAARLRSSLIRREMPPVVSVWDLVLEPGEAIFYDLPITYERYYGQAVSYSQSSGFFFGHPGFVLAGLAATSIGNAARRSSAEAQSRTQWRDWQQTRLLITNRRLVCLVNGQWMKFDFGAMVAVYPEIHNWALVCEFSGAPGPLRLSGPNAPIAAVMTIHATHGIGALIRHPSLQPLSVSTEHQAQAVRAE